MDIFELGQLRTQRAESDRAYLEVFRRPSLSMGIYHLRVGELDKQQPHSEDETYYVVAGRATVRIGAEHRPVEPASIRFLAAQDDHPGQSTDEGQQLLRMVP